MWCAANVVLELCDEMRGVYEATRGGYFSDRDIRGAEDATGKAYAAL